MTTKLNRKQTKAAEKVLGLPGPWLALDYEETLAAIAKGGVLLHLIVDHDTGEETMLIHSDDWGSDEQKEAA
jgi:hypothetical protein